MTAGRIKGLKTKLLISSAVLVFAGVMYGFSVPCVIRAVTGVPCPGCGMTRALISALRLDFVAAFLHHPLFPTVPVLYAFFLFDGQLFKKKTLNTVILTVIGLGFVANWMISIIF